MPTYLHFSQCCQQEWEEFYGINEAVPTICPKCQAEGQIKRLIFGGSGRGVVRLHGNELREKLDADAESIKREVNTNEKLLANLVGEEKYHKQQLKNDQIRRDSNGRPMIRSKK